MLAPRPMPRSMRPGGYPTDFMSQLNSGLGRNANALIGLGSGLLSAPDFSQGLAAGGQGWMQGQQQDDAYATQQKAETERQRQISVTVQAMLADGREDLANLFEGGVMEAATEYMRWKSAELKGPDPADAPANVREWEYYNALPDDATKAEYLRMKRANPYLDIGTGFVQPDPVNPGSTAGPAIPKHGDVPTGFQQTGNGAIAPMPGSPQQAEIDETTRAAVQRNQQINERADLVINKVDEALGQVAWDSTGIVGQTMGNFAGSKAYDLRRTVDTVIANIGFAELQAMREASPTGGALGQVAVQELQMLQSVLASLNADQSEQQMLINLAQVKRLLERQKMFREEAAKAGGAGAPAGGNVTSTGVPWSVEP